MLIKMQLPFFTKKIKNVGNNVKMLTEIFCRIPDEMEKTEPKSQIKSIFLSSAYYLLKYPSSYYKYSFVCKNYKYFSNFS